MGDVSEDVSIITTLDRQQAELVIAVNGIRSMEDAAVRHPLYSLSRLVRHPREEQGGDNCILICLINEFTYNKTVTGRFLYI
ncbi:jg8328 [Pararge aegeria aegeria]|uniref:Jg8328 protein n=1 Tax=Pararge aegeria aegeria TaxID=348720 RepID=A0A8S4SEF2_9NEOP|nr:jg8328 [Pararge aegeria aegeria]